MARLKAILAISSLSMLLAYVLWVCCSFLVVPFPPVPYSVPVPIWPQVGYYKLRPGQYENRTYQTRFTINVQGFRGPAFSGQPAFRIIALGESSTAGLEIGTQRWVQAYTDNLTAIVQSPVPVILIRQWIRDVPPGQPGWTNTTRQREVITIQRRIAAQFTTRWLEVVSTPEAFLDSVHLTPAGNRQLAEGIAAALIPQVDTMITTPVRVER